MNPTSPWFEANQNSHALCQMTDFMVSFSLSVSPERTPYAFKSRTLAIFNQDHIFRVWTTQPNHEPHFRLLLTRDLYLDALSGLWHLHFTFGINKPRCCYLNCPHHDWISICKLDLFKDQSTWCNSEPNAEHLGGPEPPSPSRPALLVLGCSMESTAFSLWEQKSTPECL